MKKKDLIIAAVVLLLAGILALAFRFSGGEAAGSVRVKVDGKVVGTYFLSEEQRIPFDTKYGHNLLVIEDGEAYMAESDCPDHYCEEQGRISKTGETIVCLPHRLVAEAASGTEADIDVVAK
ncbi:MAG: NusG domain II-containing protein [Clostridia bacterium]|nr:NusG domain II-containing protein [Clostridia bacterium]MBP5271753.1 NusG domain II-containing protein [Clostridia bacterium]